MRLLTIVLVAVCLSGCASASRSRAEPAEYVLMLCISVTVKQGPVTPPLATGPWAVDTSRPMRCTEGYPSCRTWLRTRVGDREVDRLARDAEAREAARECRAYGGILEAIHPSPAWTRGGAAAVGHALERSG